MTGIAVAAAAAVTAVAVLLFGELSARGDHERLVEGLYHATETVIRASVDPRFQSKATEINRALDRLVVIGAIEGSAVYDDTGHLQQTSGEAPATSFEAIRRSGVRIFATNDAGKAEFYYSPDVTGTPFHLVARVGSGEAVLQSAEATARRLAVALGAGAAVGLAIGVIMALLIVRPLNRVRAVVEQMTADPAAADRGAALSAGRSEVGALAATVERFRGTLADIWRTKVAVADAILERSPFGVIQITADGTLTSANPAAAAIFDREIARGHGAAPLVVRDLVSGGTFPIKDLIARHRGGCRLVEISGPRETRYAVTGSLTIGSETRSPTTIAMFADVTAPQLARRDAEQRFASGAALLKTARRRELELKLTLESCLTLMGGPDRREDEHLDPLPFATEWIASARESGLVLDATVTNAEGPRVEAPSEDLRAVMRLALLVAYARCGSAPADVVVDAKGVNFETAGLTVRAQPSARRDGPGEPVVADWQLALAALRTAMRRANGQLTEFSANDDGTVIRFMLRGAAERLTAVKTR